MNQLAEIDVQLGTLQREILDIERMEAENTKVHLDDLTIQVGEVFFSSLVKLFVSFVNISLIVYFVKHTGFKLFTGSICYRLI